MASLLGGMVRREPFEKKTVEFSLTASQSAIIEALGTILSADNLPVNFRGFQPVVMAAIVSKVSGMGDDEIKSLIGQFKTAIESLELSIIEGKYQEYVKNLPEPELSVASEYVGENNE